jgi:hypothetical protein
LYFRLSALGPLPVVQPNRRLLRRRRMRLYPKPIQGFLDFARQNRQFPRSRNLAGADANLS